MLAGMNESLHYAAMLRQCRHDGRNLHEIGAGANYVQNMHFLAITHIKGRATILRLLRRVANASHTINWFLGNMPESFGLILRKFRPLPSPQAF